MALETTTFDDGSTLTWSQDYGFVAATDRTDTLVNQQSAIWSPQSANPNANSWTDVLKFGLARVIDAKTRPIRPENTMPAYQFGTSLASQPITGSSLLFWLLIAGVAYFALK